MENPKKTGVTRKQSTPNFPKNKHFLPPDTHTYVCVSEGKKFSIIEKFCVLCFLATPVLRFAIMPYYQRNQVKPRKSNKRKPYCKFSNKEPCEMVYDNCAEMRHFQSKSLRTSTLRGFIKRYQIESRRTEVAFQKSSYKKVS